MKKKKWKGLVIILALVAVVGTGGFFGIRYLLQNRAKAVGVVSVESINGASWIGMGEDEGSQGTVVADVNQQVQVPEDRVINEVYVSEGDNVKIGDKLLSYDTTLLELDRELQELTVQEYELEIRSAEADLQKLRNTTPVEKSPEELEDDFDSSLLDIDYSQHDEDDGQDSARVINSEYMLMASQEGETAAAPAAETTAETQAQTQPQSQAETQPQTQAQTQAQIQPETQAQTQPETQAQTQPETQAQTQPETQAQTQPETQIQTQPETQPSAPTLNQTPGAGEGQMPETPVTEETEYLPADQLDSSEEQSEEDSSEKKESEKKEKPKYDQSLEKLLTYLRVKDVDDQGTENLILDTRMREAAPFSIEPQGSRVTLVPHFAESEKHHFKTLNTYKMLIKGVSLNQEISGKLYGTAQIDGNDYPEIGGFTLKQDPSLGADVAALTLQFHSGLDAQHEKSSELQDAYVEIHLSVAELVSDPLILRTGKSESDITVSIPALQQESESASEEQSEAASEEATEEGSSETLESESGSEQETEVTEGTQDGSEDVTEAGETETEIGEAQVNLLAGTETDVLPEKETTVENVLNPDPLLLNFEEEYTDTLKLADAQAVRDLYPNTNVDVVYWDELSETVDPKTPGDYKITYKVSQILDETYYWYVTRTVTVEPLDTTPIPVSEVTINVTWEHGSNPDPWPEALKVNFQTADSQTVSITVKGPNAGENALQDESDTNEQEGGDPTIEEPDVPDTGESVPNAGVNPEDGSGIQPDTQPDSEPSIDNTNSTVIWNHKEAWEVDWRLFVNESGRISVDLSTEGMLSYVPMIQRPDANQPGVLNITMKYQEPQESPLDKLKPLGTLAYENGMKTLAGQVGGAYKGSGTKEDPYVFFCEDGVRIESSFVNWVLGFDETGTERQTYLPEGETEEQYLGYYVILELREGDDITGAFIKTIGLDGTIPMETGYGPGTYWIFSREGGMVRYEEEVTEPGGGFEPGWPGGFDDPGWFEEGETYTAEELAFAIAEKERELRKLKLDAREAQLKLKQYDKDLAESVVYSSVNGFVKSVGGDEQSGEPYMVVSNEGGLYLRTTVNELDLDTVEKGDRLTASSWETGESFEATVTEINYFPATSESDYYWGSGNQNTSQYPVLAHIENTEGRSAYETVSVKFQSKASMSGGVYLPAPYVRSENGQSYVYKVGADEKLQKQYVKTGETKYDYVQIKEGLTNGDYVAFPYGKDVKDGAKTEEETDNMIYG